MATQNSKTEALENRAAKDFKYSFSSSKPPEDIYKLLLTINEWWSGLFGETIKGKSEKLDDEFSFTAGGGMHHTKQKLIDLEPHKKIVWLVTESNLTFLKETNEWSGTKLRFDISMERNNSKVTFTHEGLVPAFECYDECSSAWSLYLKNLEQKLK